MLDTAPMAFWFAALAITEFVLSAMVIAIIREEQPGVYKEISEPSDVFSAIGGVFYLTFFYIFPMTYESWGLKPSQIWVCRLLFASHLAFLFLLVWLLVSLL